MVRSPPKYKATEHHDEPYRCRLTLLAKDVMRSFVLHASIAKPLGEGGKLQLTSDMTELEFALSAFMAEGGSKNKRASSFNIIGEDYRALRAMRYVHRPFKRCRRG